MAMEAGSQLQHYRLLKKIGEGGMGVVWKALDTDLDREVAIKLLPDLGTDSKSVSSERLARFEREAKLLASLNHPNLATVFGVHNADGVRFLAMELIPGEDLSQRLARGPMTVAETIDLASQISDALEVAHGRGVVHRDLKPANIRITPEGMIKILDFGLAKALVSEPCSESDPALSPTITSAGTRVGSLLGTAAYMSPEQARCQEVDERSDIWSFGCVVWECLTAKVLFNGPTVSDSIAAILQNEPDWDLLPKHTPPSVRRLLQRCLAKDSGNRLHHIADARLELRDTNLETEIPSGRSYRSTVVILALTLVVSLIATWALVSRWAGEQSRLGTDNPLANARFSSITDFDGSEFDAAISPDGRFVAFVSDQNGPFEIYVGQIVTGRFRNLTASLEEFSLEDVRAPVRSVGFSGDGSDVWLGGGPWRRIRTVPLLGGPVRNFLNEDSVNVGWSPDGKQVVYHERLAGDPLFVADSNESNIRMILSPAAGIHQHFPVWSTDGQWIYVVRGRPATLEMDLWRLRTNGEDLQQLTRHKLDVRYPTPIDERTVLYSARDTDGAGPWLWSVDVETGISQRATIGLEQYASISASADGRRLVATVQDPSSVLWTVPILDRIALEQDAKPFAGLATDRALSPRMSGAAMFYLSSKGNGDGLWRFENGKSTEIWRGSETALLEPAAISPDGETAVLLLRSDDQWRLHTIRTDGTQLRVLTEAIDARGTPEWSPDGKWVVTGGYQDGLQGLYKIPVDGGVPQRIFDGEALNPVWSPDGQLIVYTGAQVNVVAPLLAVHPDGESVELPEIGLFRFGNRARFLPDGSGLIYMQGKGPAQDFWLLELATMSTRQLASFELPDTMRSFDITPDGSRIVFDRLSHDSDVVLIELSPSE